MGDLRKAAEMALEALEEFCEMQTMLRPIERRDALRQALEQPKREWVDLTEEDIQAILKEWVQTDMTVREMLREAEAKLKELNS